MFSCGNKPVTQKPPNVRKIRCCNFYFMDEAQNFSGLLKKRINGAVWP
jgi:hypothetical protein